MPKRRLSGQQAKRIARQQADKLLDAELATADTEAGKVLSRFSKQADVEAEDGTVWRCHLRRHLGDVVCGDKVAWLRQSDGTGVIVSCEPCRNRLYRPDSFGKMRAVASNIDQMLITIAPEPEPFAGMIDRYLVVAENMAVKPILLLNKSDLLTPVLRKRMDALLSDYRALDYMIIELSALSEPGLDRLQSQLCGKTSIFAGQSGVGKSSIIQTLLPNEALKIGELSEQLAKGRHTTTHTRLYHFAGGGDCIDSPGIREFGLWHFTADEVLKGFIELRELAEQCKFRDCQHRHEPGCAILAANHAEEISQRRFESYQRIVQSLDEVHVKD